MMPCPCQTTRGHITAHPRGGLMRDMCARACVRSGACVEKACIPLVRARHEMSLCWSEVVLIGLGIGGGRIEPTTHTDGL